MCKVVLRLQGAMVTIIDLNVEKIHDQHLHNLIDNEITLARSSRTNLDSFIGHENVFGLCIRFAVDGDSFDSHFTARLDHTTGNLPSVSNQQFIEERFIGIRRE